MRLPNSFLPWRADGTCTDEDMINLDLSRKGHLQACPSPDATTRA